MAIFKDITRFRRQAQKAQERQQHLMEALVRAVEYVDPNLVGGFAAYVDGRAYDFSYAAQLAALKQNLA